MTGFVRRTLCSQDEKTRMFRKIKESEPDYEVGDVVDAFTPAGSPFVSKMRTFTETFLKSFDISKKAC